MGKKRIFDDVEEGQDSGSEAEVPTKASINIDKAPKQAKPLPEGYVCNACGAIGQHAIYNCPLKISKKVKKEVQSSSSSCETEKKDIKTEQTQEKEEDESDSESESDENENDEEKEKKAQKKLRKKAKKAEAKAQRQSGGNEERYSAFVSGLSFETTRESLLQLIQENVKEPLPLTARDIIILSFPDSKRCKGLAYVNFDREEHLQLCLSLDGLPHGDRTLSFQKSAQPVKSRKQAGLEKSRQTGPRCYRCGGKHEPKECTNPRICYRCRSTEHISSNCPLRHKAA
eukprot:gene5854-6446_t